MQNKILILFVAILAAALLCFGQAPQSFFYGRTDTPAPLIHPRRFAATCSQSTTVVTCTYTGTLDVAQCYQDANTTNWGIGIGVSHVCTFGKNPPNTINVSGCGSPGFTNCSTTGYEAFAIDGTGTAMDWTPCSTNITQCSLHLTSVNTTTGAFTLISSVSQTVSSTAGFLRPAYVSVQNVHTPFGTGSQFVDPLGDWVYPIGGSGICVAGCSNSNDTNTSLAETFHTVLTNKYGSDCAAAQNETVDLAAAYFDAYYESDDAVYLAQAADCGAQFKPLLIFPGNGLAQPEAFDLQDNRFGFAAQPPMVLQQLTDRSPIDGENHADITYMSPYASTYITNAFTTTTQNVGGIFLNHQTFYDMPMAGIDELSDVDNTNIGDAGQYWPDVEFDVPAVDPGWLVAIAPLHATLEQSTPSNLFTPFHFGDDLNYEKRLSASAPAGCYMPFSFTSPSGGLFGTAYSYCSWGDLVRNYFNNSVTAMNTAFGSTYTSFGTSETAVASEAVCAAGTGVGQCGHASSLTYTLAHTNPTPSSIHILVTISASTVDVAGDCWKSVPTCANSASDSSVGTYAGEGANQGMILNNKAWQASRWIPSGWVLVDSSNNYEVAQNAGETGGTAPTWTTTTTSDNGITWKYYGPRITPGSTSNITYSSTGAGTLNLAFAATPPSTESIAIEYTFGGWGAGGTGLLDEDGASAKGGSAVVGNNSMALVAPASWQATTAYGAFTNDCDVPVDSGKCGVINTGVSGFWAIQVTAAGCTSGGSAPTFTGPQGHEIDEGTNCRWIMTQCVAGAAGCFSSTAINAKATFGLLAHMYMYERADSYYGLIYPLHQKLFPDWLFAFPNSLFINVRKENLQVMQQVGMNAITVNNVYLCGSSCGNSLTRPMDVYELAGIASVFSGAIISEVYNGTDQNEPGDPCSNSSSSDCYASLSAEATSWYTQVNNSLNLLTNYPFLFTSFNLAGRDLFSPLHDIQNNGWGFIKSYRDNRTDGIEDVSTAGVTCANGVGTKCGGEATGVGTLCSGSPCWATPWGYNAWGGATGIIAANKLWLQAASSPATHTLSPGTSISGGSCCRLAERRESLVPVKASAPPSLDAHSEKSVPK